MNRDSRDQAIIRDLLERIDNSADVNQRALARELGIALGMTNTYIRRCVKKGWVKINEVPARRYRYYLTPKGFAEKSRLTAEYFTSSLQFFRKARQSFDRLYEQLADQGVREVVLYGADDLTEIAALCMPRHSVNGLGVIVDKGAQADIAGLPVFEPAQAPRADRWVLAVASDADEAYRQAVARVGAAHIAVPDVLKRVLGPGG